MSKIYKPVLPCPDNTLAIYIHWPYCTRICPYCDFNVYKQRSDSELIGAICDDLTYWRQWGGKRRVSSIHFGGGTPSLLKASEISKVLNKIYKLWDVMLDCEIALEANPNDVDVVHLQDYRSCGVNRISIGVQSFYDPALKMLGRNHNQKDAQKALDMAVKLFPSVSADIIYGWQGQNEVLLAKDIDILLGYGLGHISAYQLTIEDDTAFAKAQIRGDIKTVNTDISAQLYDYVVMSLTQAGFIHYEVSNFAKAHQVSHHNLAYWQGRDYVGVGPGAHGRMTINNQRHATVCAMRPKDYIEHVKAQSNGLITKQTLTPQERGEEYIIMGLRIKDGISLQYYKDISDQNLPQNILDDLISDGLIEIENGRLKTSAAGRMVLNKITDELLIN